MAKPRHDSENVADVVESSWTEPMKQYWTRGINILDGSWTASFEMRSGCSVVFGVNAHSHAEALKRGLEILYGTPNFMTVLDNRPGPGY